MKENFQRIVIWVIAMLFVVSSIGTVVYYVIANRQQQQLQDEYQKAISQQTQQTTNAAATKSTDTKLTGTKLAGFELIANITTLQKQDVTTGSGAEAKAGDTVTVKYVGALAKNGTIFDASSDHGQDFSFKVGGGQVIQGWDIGVPGMKVGGKRRLLIPASLGYGSQAAGASIPANSDLVFDVELVKIGS